MSEMFKPVKLGAIKFVSTKTYDEYVNEIVKKEREARTLRLKELKATSLWRLIYAAISCDFPGFIITPLFIAAMVLLFGATLKTAVLTVVYVFLFAIIMTALNTIFDTKCEIRIRTEENEKASKMTDAELFEYDCAYPFFNIEKERIKDFFELQHKTIVAAYWDEDYEDLELKVADEKGDVSETELVCDAYTKNIKIESSLMIELTDDFKIIVREKE